jgi:hypothetical protein
MIVTLTEVMGVSGGGGGGGETINTIMAHIASY